MASRSTQPKTSEASRVEGRPQRADALATRERIVATAELLFAEHGLDGVSLLEVGRAAGQKNRSAVQYHFGQKRGLLEAILDKHTPGIEVRRQEMLDDLEAEANTRLRSLVEVLVWPVADKLVDRDGGVAFIRVNAELVGHPRHPLLSIDSERPNRAAKRLRQLMTTSTPRLPREVWASRWLLVMGLLFHGLADWSRLSSRARPGRDVFVNQLIDTIQVAVEAPLSRAARTALKRN